jgi:hypothetical protein
MLRRITFTAIAIESMMFGSKIIRIERFHGAGYGRLVETRRLGNGKALRAGQRLLQTIARNPTTARSTSRRIGLDQKSRAHFV